MLIYLIEDDNLKSKQIIPFAKSVIPDATIEHYRSYQSGLKAIDKTPPHLVILDMTLPTFDMTGISRHGRPRSLGGVEIMRKMKRKHIACPVYIISALETFGDGRPQISFEEVQTRCKNEFPDLYLGGVFFSQSSDRWKQALQETLLSIVKAN